MLMGLRISKTPRTFESQTFHEFPIRYGEGALVKISAPYSFE